ncbi:ATP-binding protein [Megalodesulfovibrio paquesii]
MPGIRLPLVGEIRFNLKNKILFSSLAVIMLVSVAIALVARYILISSLTRELEYRGLGIAHSIADRATGLILTQDLPQLVSLAFEATSVGERKDLVAHIYILDTEQHVLASTFIKPFPDDLRTANILPSGWAHSIKLLNTFDEPTYDIAVPVKEGIYSVGSVHVGLSKEHIDRIVGQLRMAFLGFITGIILIMSFISERLSRHITRPIRQLIHVSEEISRDNLDVPLEFSGRHGDEVIQLANAFEDMVKHIKEYRAELRRSQQKYRSLFHSGPDPIFVLDCERLTVLDANPMALDTYCYSKKELLGLSFRLLSPEFVDVCHPTFSMEDKDAQASCMFLPKVINYRRGGEPFFVNIHACATIYEEQPAIIVSTNDIQDMIEKDAQLIQASKMKSLGEMSAGMAHEINQPLNAIKIGSEYLQLIASRDGDIPREPLVKVTAEISRQVDRASEIITTLREFGRKADLTKEKMDIAKPLKGVFHILGHQLALANIEVQYDLTPDLPRILAHNNRLEQVLFNLVSNARDAILAREAQLIKAEQDPEQMPRHIRIASFARNGRVCLSVQDSGTGILQSDLDKIFEPFYTTKETGKGMGLGLAISYGIVKDYQGDIAVHSAPGEGATFTLTFPAAP